MLSENPEHPPYPAWMHGLVMFGVFLLPLNSLLAAWALGLRIEQYGLTVDRLWAATIQLLIASFTLSYSVLILLRRARALTASVFIWFNQTSTISEGCQASRKLYP